MNKKTKDFLIFFIFFISLAVFILTNIYAFKKTNEKQVEVDYRCEFTYYGETKNEGTLIVEDYSYPNNSTLVEVITVDGDVLLIDLSKVSMLCGVIPNTEEGD